MGLELARCGGNVVEMGAGIIAIGDFCGMVSGFFEIFFGGARGGAAASGEN